ncbi:hypothetical protein MT391_11085 [Vibrio sp. 1-Bac 57]
MANFYQQNQHIQNQYNAEIINFSNVKDIEDFTSALQKLQTELNRAIEEKIIVGESAIDAEMSVKKAILQSKESIPDKNKLVNYLQTAKVLASNVEGLVTSLTNAISRVGNLF